MTELVLYAKSDGTPESIIDYTTGEVISLKDETDRLVAARAAIMDVERAFRDVKKAIDQELIARMDRRARWTIHAAGRVVSAPAPDREDAKSWDGAALHDLLTGLVEAGEIDDEAAKRAVKVTIEYVPQLAGIHALLKTPVKDRVETCRLDQTAARRVTVK